jgi:hypothetical protein
MSGSSPRYFVIEVRSACDLKDVQAFGSQVRWAAFCAFPLTPPAMRALQDPYVLAYPFPSRKTLVQTSPAASGGTDPTWSPNHSNLVCIALEESDKTIRLELWNANLIVDDLIGCTEIKVDSFTPGELVSYPVDTGGLLQVCMDTNTIAIRARMLVFSADKNCTQRC